MKGQKKVVVAFSGGKDSTAAIVLLKAQNYNVHALTMKIGLDDENHRLEKIRNLAEVLKVPLKVVDITSSFREKVVEYFIQSYAKSLTPNPCTICNSKIKFDLLFKEALQDGTDFYATGHYAKKIEIDNEFFLTEPKDRVKSQIYFLALIGKEVLRHVLFPVGELTIDEVREVVENLPLANREESQDVCFLNNFSLMEFLQEHLPDRYFNSGYFLDIHGNEIGTHKGAVHFTIGQRRGIQFSSDRRLYVIRKDVENNTITLGEEKYLYSRRVKVIDPIFWRRIEVGETLRAKFRYQSSFYPAIINEVSPNHIIALFPEPAKSITPGQIAAFYEKEIIVAGGIIA